jgi:glycosyltransferase involved in cell wall biosynthesis
MTTGKTPPDASKVEEIRKVADRVDLVPRSRSLSSIFTADPTLVATNRTLASLPLEDEYELALADSEFSTPIFDNPRLRARLRVLRVHNDESRYYWTMAKAEKQPHWKAFFALEAVRFRWFSRRQFRRLDGIWFISMSERDRVSLEFPELRSKCYWIPPAIDLRVCQPRTETQMASREVLIVGTLNGSLNQEGIRWYIQHVHPILREDPAYRLTIAGGTRGWARARRFADEISGTDRCEVHVDRADLSPLYSRAGVLVNPMQRGAGVKVKTVHAVLEGRPLVTTSAGADGSGFRNLDHIRIEDDPTRFAKAIQDIFDHPEAAKQMTDRARRYLFDHYNQEVQIRRFLTDRLTATVDGKSHTAPPLSPDEQLLEL